MPDSSFYRPAAYAIAQTVVDIPLVFVQVFLFDIVVYWMAGLAQTPSQFFISLLILWIVSHSRISALLFWLQSTAVRCRYQYQVEWPAQSFIFPLLCVVIFDKFEAVLLTLGFLLQLDHPGYVLLLSRPWRMVQIARCRQSVHGCCYPDLHRVHRLRHSTNEDASVVQMAHLDKSCPIWL